MQHMYHKPRIWACLLTGHEARCLERSEAAKIRISCCGEASVVVIRKLQVREGCFRRDRISNHQHHWVWNKKRGLLTRGSWWWSESESPWWAECNKTEVLKKRTCTLCVRHSREVLHEVRARTWLDYQEWWWLVVTGIEQSDTADVNYVTQVHWSFFCCQQCRQQVCYRSVVTHHQRLLSLLPDFLDPNQDI